MQAITSSVLNYAPSRRSNQRWVIVLLAGAFTTALTLTGSWAAEHYSKGDFTLMGLYGWGILPVGALMLGIASASGYAGAASLVGIRIRRYLLLAILFVTLFAYALSHYLVFRSQGPLILQRTGAPLTFLDYFDLTTRSIHYVSDAMPKAEPPPHFFGKGAPITGDETPQGLGVWGYGVRALELGAFSIAAVCTPLVLRKRAYCDLCQRYHKRYRLAVLPASVPVLKTLGVFSPRKVKLDGPHAIAAAEAAQALSKVAHAISVSEPAIAFQLLQEFKPGTKAAEKLPRRFEVWLDRCAQCGRGTLRSTVVTGIDPRNTTRHPMWDAPVSTETADILRPR